MQAQEQQNRRGKAKKGKKGVGYRTEKYHSGEKALKFYFSDALELFSKQLNCLIFGLVNN